MHLRYEDLIFDTEAYAPTTAATLDRLAAVKRKGVHHLKVFVASNDQSLNLETDESYALTVAAPTSTLEVHSAGPCAASTQRLLCLSRSTYSSQVIRDSMHACMHACRPCT